MKIQNQLGYIKGITFAPFHKCGSLSTQTARDSFDYMIEHTAADRNPCSCRATGARTLRRDLLHFQCHILR